MNVENLVRMANQIGAFFEAMPDRDAALEGIATHLRKFWAPRMRAQLQAHAVATGGGGLSPIVIEALGAHAILQQPDPVARMEPGAAAERHAFDGASEA